MHQSNAIFKADNLTGVDKKQMNLCEWIDDEKEI